jgi:hypothetical protein
VHDVNLIGEYNIAGEFWYVAPLFDELGLRILCTLSGDARFHEVQTMHRAQASMVVCAKALLNVARKLEVDFGVPFFEGSFYGISDTSQAFRDFARLLGDADLAARTEAMIAREEARIRAALEPWRARVGRQAGAALHRWRQELVGGFGPPGSRHDGGRHRHQQIHRGRQGAHPRDHGRRDENDHRRQPEGAAAGLQGLPGGHPDRRRTQPVHGVEGADSLSRHQPGTRIRLRRLRRACSNWYGSSR